MIFLSSEIHIFAGISVDTRGLLQVFFSSDVFCGNYLKEKSEMTD